MSRYENNMGIADSLVRELRRITAMVWTKGSAQLEGKLSGVLKGHRTKPRFHLRDASYGEGGLQPDVEEGTWKRTRDFIYGGRGS